jgi:8-oxo-dGTP diphosphatase
MSYTGLLKKLQTSLQSSDEKPSLNGFIGGAFSIDIVVFTYHEGKLKILLQETEDKVYFRNKLGLPGKLMHPKESTDSAMDVLLISTLGFSDFYKKQLNAFSDLDRHPLGRVVTIAYYGLLSWERVETIASKKKIFWMELNEVPELSYDHNQILRTVLKRFRKGLLSRPIVFELLPHEFIISEIIGVYELAFEKKLDVPNFRKQILKSNLIIPLDKYKSLMPNLGRPAELYRFDKSKYKQSKDKVTFNF